MSVLFNRDRSVISRHIQNIFLDGELKSNSSCAKNAHEVNGQVYYTDYYNLDVIVSVGNRIRSNILPVFNEWCKQVIESLKRIDKSNIIRFENDDISLDVTISPQEETVYLTKDQLAVLFGTTRQTIEYHIKNICNSGELEIGATCKEILQVRFEGGREVERLNAYYNLDMIISIGYRTNSKRGIAFRRWASNVLKGYLLKGYVINENRTLVTNENYINLIHKVENIDNRLCALEKSETIKNEKIFYDGSFFDARLFIKTIFNEAKKEIVLVDPYSDKETLDVLKDKRSGVKVSLYTSSKTKITKRDVDSFNSRYGNLSINTIDSFHDRFIIIDDSILFHVGASINYAGKKAFAITKMIDKESLVLIKNRLV